jgi:3-oxoadipate enol-lactonase/4-carboxymuconolactone decarboxylase
MASIADAVLARWFTPNFRTTHAAQFDGYAAMLRQQHPHGYISTCAALRDADLRPHLPQITAPTLVVCGTADSSTPPALSEALRDGIAGARLTWIEGAAHLPCIEKPAEVAAAIAGFVDTLAHAAYDTHTRGMAVRRAVLGDAHVDKAEANKTEFDADFQRFITEMAWGSVWARPGLGRHTRHLLTIAMLAALGKEHELAMHIRATQNTGVTQSEVKEVLLQVAVYAGLPAANRAIAIAKKIFEETT